MKSLLKALALLACFITSNNSLYAQKIELIPKNYTFYNMGTGASTFDRAYYFMLDDDKEPRKIGYFGQYIRPYLLTDTNALKYLNAYRNHQTLKLTTSIATIVSFIGFAASNLGAKSVAQGNLDKPSKGRGFLYATIGFAVTNIVTRLVGTKSIKKAVEAYNTKTTTSQFKFKRIDFDLQNLNRQKAMALVFNF